MSLRLINWDIFEMCLRLQRNTAVNSAVCLWVVTKLSNDHTLKGLNVAHKNFRYDEASASYCFSGS